MKPATEPPEDLHQKIRSLAYTDFFNEHYQRLQRYCRCRWRHAVADDVLAEAMIVAWRRFDDIPCDGAFGWLCGVARNSALNLHRSQVRWERNNDLAEFDERSRRQRSDVDAVDLRSDLAETLGRLPERDREILLLVAWEGLSGIELGAYLGVSANAAMIRLCRARARFSAAWAHMEAAAA